MKTRLKQILCIILGLLFAFSSIEIPVFAESSTDKQAHEIIEEGKIYSIPLIDYHYSNVPNKGKNDSGFNQLASRAMISSNGDGTYHVTLKIRHFDWLDIVQISKPGAILDSEGKSWGEIPMGDFNVPEHFHCEPQPDQYEKYPKDEIKNWLFENGYIDAAYNDKYIQDYSVKRGDSDAAYYSFDIPIKNCEEKMFIQLYTSCALADDTHNRKNFRVGWQQKRIRLDFSNIQEVKDLSAVNYNKSGVKLVNVDDHPDSRNNTLLAVKVNKYFSDTTVKQSENGLLTTVKFKDNVNVSSVQEIVDYLKFTKREYPYPKDYTIRKQQEEYAKAFSGDSTKNKYAIGIYSDELLQGKQFQVQYNTIEDIVFGKEVHIAVDDKEYYGELCLYSLEKQPIKKVDGDITLISDSYNVKSETEFKANQMPIDEDKNSLYNKIYALASQTGKDVMIYTPNLTINGQDYNVEEPIELHIKLPEGWNPEKVKVLHYVSNILQGQDFSYVTDYHDESKGVSYKTNEKECVLNTAFLGETFALVQESEETDISALTDGIYKLNANVWQKDNPTNLSMANAAIDNEYVYLTVENNGKDKKVYFDIKGIPVATLFGYCNKLSVANTVTRENGGNLQLSDWKELEYYQYHLDEKGGLDVDPYATDLNLYYPKRVGLTLPEYANTENGIYVEFCVPIMDDLGGYVPGSGDGSRVAKISFTNAEKVAEYVEAKHDKTVLVVAVDKAKNYKEEDYTKESYKALSDAVNAAQKVIDSEAKPTDKEVVELNNNISKAIKNLRKPGEETPEQKYQRLYKKASQELNMQDYTPESWGDLFAVVAKHGNKPKDVELANKELEAAINNLVPITSIVQLEPGVYEAPVSMKNIDGTLGQKGFVKSARLFVGEDGKATAYLYTTGIDGLTYREGFKFAYPYVPEYSVATADQTDADGHATRFNFVLPANVPNHRVKINSGSEIIEQFVSIDLASLVKKDVDKTALQEKLDAAKALNEKEYTADSFKALKKAIADAEKVLADKVAFSEEVEASIAAIDGKIEALKKDQPEETPEQKYQRLYKKASQELNMQDYTPESWGDLFAVVAKHGNKPKDVELANKELEAAINDLVPISSILTLEQGLYSVPAKLLNLDKTASDSKALKSVRLLVGEDGKATVYLYTEGVSEMTYREGFKFAYPYIPEYSDATVDQKDQNGNVERISFVLPANVSNHKIRLNDGENTVDQILSLNLDALEKQSVDKTALQEKVDVAKALNEKEYTADSFKALKKAIADAEKVLADKAAFSEEVDKVVEALDKASAALKKVEADKSKLNQAIEEAEVKEAKDYTPESFAALTTAIEKAKTIAKDSKATQEAVDAETENLIAVMGALVPAVPESKDGLYEINAAIYNATEPDTLSMANGALEKGENGETKPLKLRIKDRMATLSMKMIPLTFLNQTGYLGELNYYPDYKDTVNVPGEEEYLVRSDVEKEYDIFDVYNDPESGTDEYMKGRKYPEVLSVPVELNDEEMWIQVYVPVMESIQAGTGTKAARLRLDWNSLKQIPDDELNVAALENKIAEAKAVEQGKASKETWDALQKAIEAAEAVLKSESSTQEQIDAQIPMIDSAIKKVNDENNVVINKATLKAEIDKAQKEAEKTDVYTAESIAKLKEAIKTALTVYETAEDQEAVDKAVKDLKDAEQALKKLPVKPKPEKPEVKPEKPDVKPDTKPNTSLDYKNLPDGVYIVQGTMVKPDKVTPSMSDNAINHNIMLTVKDGKYYLTLDFTGLSIGEKVGYLSELKYFLTNYALDAYGRPMGDLADVIVGSFQLNPDGTKVTDQYGTDYPDKVTFELIQEALEDGLVPLQVFVPVMESITAGTGKQVVFLKLDWSTLKETTADNPDFEDGNVIKPGNSAQTGNSGKPGIAGKPGIGTKKPDMKPAVKTGDVASDNVLWATLLLMGVVMALAGVVEYRRRKNF